MDKPESRKADQTIGLIKGPCKPVFGRDIVACGKGMRGVKAHADSFLTGYRGHDVLQLGKGTADFRALSRGVFKKQQRGAGDFSAGAGYRACHLRARAFKRRAAMMPKMQHKAFRTEFRCAPQVIAEHAHGSLIQPVIASREIRQIWHVHKDRFDVVSRGHGCEAPGCIVVKGLCLPAAGIARKELEGAASGLEAVCNRCFKTVGNGNVEAEAHKDFNVQNLKFNVEKIPYAALQRNGIMKKILELLVMHACATIGHSNHSLETLIRILQAHRIDTVIDVRSAPYSRRHPQFNRETLKTDVQLYDLRYLYLGDLLGGRQTDPRVLLPDGGVDFSRVRELPSFQEGIRRVLAEIKQGFSVALLCAEKDPFDCHRFLLLSPALVAAGVTVTHIIGEGRLVPQEELEERLLKQYGLTTLQPKLFEQLKTRAELLAEAFALKNRER